MRYHVKLILLFMLFQIISAGNIFSQILEISQSGDKNLSLFTGIEYAELLQNPNTGINLNNWTFTAGAHNLLNDIGISYLGFSVDLGDDHLQNPNQVAFIEGPRESITGDVSAHRLWIDWTPLSIDVLPHWFFPNRKDLALLRITPVLMTGPGWNSWGFQEKVGTESYRLNAFTWSLGLRLRTVVAGFIFIENPLFDAFVYLWKSRMTAGNVGDVSITRPEGFGLFSWATIGIELTGLFNILENTKQ